MIQCTLSRSDKSPSSIEDRSNEQLVADAKLGDQPAFTELWRRFGKSARNAAWKITANREDTEDVLQDTFLKSYLHIGQFDGRAKFSTWLVRIAINSALMMVRKRRGRSEIGMTRSGEDISTSMREFRDLSQDTESRYIRSERSTRLRVAILTLQPPMRNILVQRHELELSVKEIALMNGLSIPATKTRLLRARIALRESLEHHDRTISRLSDHASCTQMKKQASAYH